MSENNALPPVVVDNHRRFLNLLTPHLANEAAADDVLRRAYAQARDKAGDLKDSQKIIPWFLQLLRNAVVLHIRNEKLPGKISDDVDGRLVIETNACVDDLLKSLKPEHTALINKAEVQNRAIKDIAHAARTSPGDIETRLQRARAALKKKILQTCGVCATHAAMDCACRQAKA